MRRTRFALVAFLAAFMAALMSASLAAAQDPVAGDFEKVTLDDDTQNPMEMDIATDGRVFYVERDGRVQVWNPATGQTSTAGTIPVTQSQENGLLGITLANDFDTTGHLYLSYSALPDSSEQNRLSRFTIENNAIVAGSERVIYTWQHQVAQCCRTPGGWLRHRARRQHLHLDRRQHEPVRLERLLADRRATRPRVLGRPAHVGEHEQRQRQDPPPRAGRRPERHARRRDHVHDPGEQPLRERQRAEDDPRDLRDGLPQPVPGSRSTRRRAGC